MPGKKKFPDLTGDGKVTKADILKGRGVPGFKHGGKVHRDPGQVEREMQAEAERRKERDRRFLEGTLFNNNADFTDIEKSERRGDDKPVKKFKHGGKVDVKKLPRSMKERKRGFGFSGGIKHGNPEEVKENRKPKTKEERAGGRNPTDEQRIKARFADEDRKEFEKKVQGKMGSFADGGEVCVGGGSDRTQGGRSAVRGTKFSGTY